MTVLSIYRSRADQRRSQHQACRRALVSGWPAVVLALGLVQGMGAAALAQEVVSEEVLLEEREAIEAVNAELGLVGAAVERDWLQEPISCMLTPWREARIAVDQSGIVTSREVRRTQAVRQGDVLVTLNAGLAQADLDRALLSRDALKARLERSENLTQNNVIARDEIEKLRAEYGLAEVELRAAEERLRKTTVLAPFDGVITGVAVEAGELTGSSPLLTLAEVARLKALLIFPVEAWGQYVIGQELGVGALVGGHERQGKIVSIDSFIDPSANSFTLEVELENSDLVLPAGSACRLL